MKTFSRVGHWIFKLADEANVGICLADDQKAVRYLNHYHLAHIWKNPTIQSPTDALGQPISEVFPSGLSSKCELLFDQVVSTGQWASIRESIDLREGLLKTVEVSAVPLGKEDAERSSVVMLSSDLSASSLEDLVSRELQYCATSFSVIYHELRNYLQVISGGVVILNKRLSPGGDEIIEKALEHVSSGVEQLQGFLKKSSDLLRPISRRSVFNRETVDLNEFLTENIEAFKSKIAYLSDKVAVSLDLDEPLPPVSVNTRNMFDLLWQLLQNSVEAMPGGGEINLSTSYMRDASSPFVQAEVADNGHGMDENVRRFAFRPFYTTKADRLGLGLPICRKIMKDHGGNLFVHSKPGKGTSVKLVFRGLSGVGGIGGKFH